MKVIQMFTAFFKKSTAETQHDQTLEEANEALKTRMRHMLRASIIPSRVPVTEFKTNGLVKTSSSNRKAFAA
jgi:hypothetical protein